MRSIFSGQTLAAQLISSAPLPCSPAEREELSTNLEELEQEQQEEQEAILELENQLDALVVSIRQLEEQVERNAKILFPRWRRLPPN